MRVTLTMKKFWRENEKVKLNNQNNFENFYCETFSLQIIKMIKLIISEKIYLFEKTSDIYNLKTRKDSILLDSRAYFVKKFWWTNVVERCRTTLR